MKVNRAEYQKRFITFSPGNKFWYTCMNMPVRVESHLWDLGALIQSTSGMFLCLSDDLLKVCILFI